VEKLTLSTEIVWCKVVWSLVVEVIYEPTVSEWAIGDVSHSEFFASFNQAIRLVYRLENRVLRLHGIDLGDYGCQWEISLLFRSRNLLELALRSVLAEHSERPMYLVLPALRISSSAGMDSSRGVV
jgi:hypothetical protein